jgi:protocatechuate 3,4-dioxygenase beta subunit
MRRAASLALVAVTLVGSAGLCQEERKDAESGVASAAMLSASGTVVDAAGKPVAGARVILREWSVYRVRGRTPKETEGLISGADEIADTLAETTTDALGQFRFEGVRAPRFPQVPNAGQSVFPWDLVVLAPGHGLAWQQLTPHHQRTPVTLTLGAEGVLHGRVVETGGRGVAGAKVKVFGIDPLGRPVDNGLGTDNRLNLIWSAFPLGAKTDADGRFTIPGLPRDRIITLIVTRAQYERLVAYAATTDAAQPDNVSRTFRSGQAMEHRQPVHSDTFTLTAKPTDHVLTGRVVYEADGKPAAGATVLYHAKPIKTDAEGRFRIEGLTAGPLELHAISRGSESDAAPVDLAVEIPEEPKEFTRDLVLPRGLVVTGRVVDGSTGRGVEKAQVDFNPETKPEPGRIPTLFGFMKETDAEGRFRLVVPPGRGTLLLRSLPPDFPPLQRRVIGAPPDPQMSRTVEGRGGETAEVAEFRLARAAGVVLRVLDPAGRPVANARVDIRDINRWPRNEPGHTDAQGRFEAVGLAPGQATVFDIIAADAPLGATVEVEAEAAGGQGQGKTVEVPLQPLGSLSGRVLDDEGRPLAGPVIHLYRDVRYRDQSGRSFGLPVETRNDVNADGSYTFDRLIPGATYHSQAEVGGHATASSNHVKIKSGEAARVDDFRLPALGGEVRGVVVDSRGKPVAGVTVGYERTDQTRSMYAPAGAVWFQDTDAAGRFHLTGLPRGHGPIRLMAYRRPEGANRSIRDMKYVDVPPGAADVRIELREANDRLRGID